MNHSSPLKNSSPYSLGTADYYAFLFLPDTLKPPVAAIISLHKEWERLLYRTQELSVAAQTFSWWQQALSETLREHKSDHPLLQTLLSLDCFKRIPHDHFHALLHSLYQQLHPQIIENEEDLLRYSHERLGVRELMLCHLNHTTELSKDDIELSQAYAIAEQLFRNIEHFPEELKRGQSLLPRSWNEDPHDPAQRLKGLKQLTEHAIAQAERCLMTSPDRHSVWIMSHLKLSLKIKHFKKLMSDDFKSPLEPMPLKNLWRAYVAFKKL